MLGGTYLSHHVVAHGVLLRGGQQGSLRGSLGLWRLRRAGQKATAGLGGHGRRANIRADEGQAWRRRGEHPVNIAAM